MDEQIQGPFAKWVHRHEFEDIGGKTRLTDRVAYQLPGGPISQWALQLDGEARTEQDVSASAPRDQAALRKRLTGTQPFHLRCMLVRAANARFRAWTCSMIGSGYVLPRSTPALRSIEVGALQGLCIHSSGSPASSGTQRRTYPPAGSNFSPWITGLNIRKYGSRVSTAARDPLPSQSVVGEVCIHQRVPEPCSTFLPANQQMFDEK